MKEPDKVRKTLEDLGPGYELVRELGRGTTAVVYLVRDHELGRDLAVKVIRSTFTHDEEAVARLQREARLVAQLQHPNIVRVFSTRHFPDGSLGLLMEHVPGRTLRELLGAAGPLPATRVLSVLRDVASALAYAHRRRIVHRDVKPENIYVDDEVGTARLADFGIARPWDRDARLTVPGEALGTPAYMSPEQIDGDDVDGRTDVYSLGLVGYEMLAGRHPWEGDNLFTIIYKQKNEELPPLRSVRPHLPTELVRVLEGALQKDRERRWGSADVLLEQLNAIRGPGRPGAPAPGRQAAPTDPGWGSGSAGEDAPAAALGERMADGMGAAPGPDRPAAGAEAAGRADLPADVVPHADVPTEATDESRRPGRRGRVVRATLGLAALALGVWGWTVWQGRDAEGWIDLVEPAPGVRSDGGAGAASPAASDRDAPAGGDQPAPGPGAGEPTGSATAAGRTPNGVVAIVGQRQVGEVGTFLPRDLGVRVVDARGDPVPGAEVRFEILAGDGFIAPPRARTDSAGHAFARWRLGSARGDQRAAAVVPAGGDTLVFQAVAQGPASAAAGATPSPPPTEADPPDRPTSGAPTAAGDEALDSAAAGGPEPGGAANVVPRSLAVGGTHVCSLDDRGSARCLGALDPTGAGEPSPPSFAAVASGVSHGCALDPGGAAFCWGANDAGQLGDGGRTDRAAPTPVETDSRFTRLSLGLGHSCGLDVRGRAQCWGRNVNGQLGDGSRDDRTVPRPVAGPTMVQVAAGWNHTCALDAAGRPWCWGLNSDGQLGDGSRIDRLTPTPVAGEADFSALAAGSAHTCGLGGGVVRCWGADAAGQLGIGGTGPETEPVRIESLPGTVVQLVAGAVHTCALLEGGEARCWGQNVHGQLGDGSTTDRRLPVPVSGDLRFRSLAAGGGSTCGVTDEGSRYCWGLNQSGQLGDGTRTNRATPTRARGRAGP